MRWWVKARTQETVFHRQASKHMVCRGFGRSQEDCLVTRWCSMSWPKQGSQDTHRQKWGKKGILFTSSMTSVSVSRQHSRNVQIMAIHKGKRKVCEPMKSNGMNIEMGFPQLMTMLNDVSAILAKHWFKKKKKERTNALYNVINLWLC